MIHSGSVVAAGISQGTSSTFGWDFGVFKYFRNDSEKRDFVSAGAAAGVAAAFGAPVGGVLFALEEGSSFWKQKLTWRVFFSALLSCFALNFFLSLVNGDTGDLSNPGLLNLGKFNDLSYRFFEFIPFMFIGVFEGLLGSLFNFINYKLTVIRMRYLGSPFLRIAEALFVSQLTTLCSALMIYFIQDCRKKTSSDGIHIQMFCKDGEESTVALLLLQTPEACVRSLFHDPNGSFNWSTVTIFFFVYFFLACGTYGLGVPSGLFIPTLLTGAAFGRICGMEWVDEGKYALVGAAAGLAGVVRMTISLTVILMECVGNITFGLPLMIVVVIAKFVGDFFNEIFNENTHVWDGNIVHMELFRACYPRYPSVEEVSLTEEELGTTIDLRPFMNPSPYTVTSASSFQRIFHLFRGLGLRHLIVLNDEHRVVGIITRKDIVKFDFVHENGGVSLIQLEICDAI
ncbi:H(+)/Cl(-) exchange transporter 7 [Armadillidium nasatum]|uniref:Chloride channel protein n=1 Tax=Armadillidium nasatum TaxID=96803 RepID=A0A5N5T0R5_9CRUS|nr:H(+)/Cl(-) exchange transporter 7 [Armadillidium nasatum]